MKTSPEFRIALFVCAVVFMVVSVYEDHCKELKRKYSRESEYTICSNWINSTHNVKEREWILDNGKRIIIEDFAEELQMCIDKKLVDLKILHENT